MQEFLLFALELDKLEFGSDILFTLWFLPLTTMPFVIIYSRYENDLEHSIEPTLSFLEGFNCIVETTFVASTLVHNSWLYRQLCLREKSRDFTLLFLIES